MSSILKMTLLSLALLTTVHATETVYEDAEDGNTNGWRVYDNNPAGATVTNVVDADKNSRVIVLQGQNVANGYILGNDGGAAGAWHNENEKILTLDVKYGEDYMFFVSVETATGPKYLYYSSVNGSRGVIGNGRYVHIGLGRDHKNNEWYTERRDLEADLKRFEPDNTILSVEGIMIRGSGRVDNISLSTANVPPVHGGEINYESAEDGDTTGWSIYDRTPAGASITNVASAEKGSRVIHLSGAQTSNGYMIGNWEGRVNAWNDRERHYIAWDMNFDEWSMIFVNVETTQGHRFMYYTPRATNRGIIGGGEYIHHGIGSNAESGRWFSVTRDLEADLQEYEPNNHIVSVNGMLIRGSGEFDNIRLSDAPINIDPPAPLAPTLYEDFESGNMDKWTLSHDGGRADRPPYKGIAAGFDGSKYSGAFRGSNIGSQNTYRLAMENDQQFFLEMDLLVGNAGVISHGMIGLRIDTDKGPRLIYWDAYRNRLHYEERHNGTRPSIKYYGAFATIALGNPAEEEGQGGLRHFKVNVDEQLQIFEPGNHVRKIWYLDYGNSNRVDNIKLSSN